MQRLFAAGLFAAALSSSMFAQCSTLTVTGSFNPGQTITIDVSGATANASTFIFVGPDDTSTTLLDLGPLGSTTIGLAVPWVFFPIGQTDSSGHVSLAIPIDASFPQSAIPNTTWHSEGLTVAFDFLTFSLSFCDTNLADVVFGTG